MSDDIRRVSCAPVGEPCQPSDGDRGAGGGHIEYRRRGKGILEGGRGSLNFPRAMRNPTAFTYPLWASPIPDREGAAD